MKINIFLLFLLILMVFASCNKKRERELLEGKNEVCLSDTVPYYVIISYPDGQTKEEGMIKGLKKDWYWTESYIDGEVRRYTYYKNGQMLITTTIRTPELTFEYDSLVVNVATKVRVQYLEYGQDITCSPNAKLEKLEDNSMYDYELTPLDDQSINLFYKKITAKDARDMLVAEDYRNYARKKGITEKEAREIITHAFIPVETLLTTLHVTPNK